MERANLIQRSNYAPFETKTSSSSYDIAYLCMKKALLFLCHASTYYKKIFPLPLNFGHRSNSIFNFMDPKLRFSIIIFLLLFVELYPARVNSLRMTVDVVKSPTKVYFQMKGRKLLKLDTDDYKEYGGPNPRNDQGKTKPHG
ncbi:hypothetical protein E2542_SST17851 [Spatholobus suberectus]|nr:hypothetical protein E2542_SST17851 [Spatholobus suberectus]